MPSRRKSDAAKRAAGSYRPSNHRDVTELPPGTPRAPKWLEPEAKREWTRVVRALSAAGALSEAHRSTLVTYAVLWGEFEAAHGKVPTPRLSELRRLTAELGISPRSGTVGPPAEPLPPLQGGNVTPLRPGNYDIRAESAATMKRLREIGATLTPPKEPK